MALLRTGRRGLQRCCGFAHNAEHWLSDQLNAYMRDDDEYRAITRQTIIRGTAGIIAFAPETITVTLQGPPSPASPAPWPCSPTRSTPFRRRYPATPGPSPTSSQRARRSKPADRTFRRSESYLYR